MKNLATAEGGKCTVREEEETRVKALKLKLDFQCQQLVSHSACSKPTYFLFEQRLWLLWLWSFQFSFFSFTSFFFHFEHEALFAEVKCRG